MRVELDDLTVSPEVVEIWSTICAHAAIRLQVLAFQADPEDVEIGEEYGVLHDDGTLAIVCDVKLRDKTVSITMAVPDGHWSWREQKLN